MISNKFIGQGLTYDDVLLVPAFSDTLPRDVSIKTKFSKNIPLNIPSISAAMDTETESRILERLKEYNKDQTTLIVSHRISTIRNAQNIIVINEGEIIEKGTHKELISQKGFYEQMYQQQLHEEQSDQSNQEPEDFSS